MNPHLQATIDRLKAKPPKPNIPYALVTKIKQVASDYADENPWFGKQIEREIIIGAAVMLRSNIPSWMYTLTKDDWREFIAELSKIPDLPEYLVWNFKQMRERLK